MRTGNKEEDSGTCEENRAKEADAVKKTEKYTNGNFKVGGVGVRNEIKNGCPKSCYTGIT